jgi:hypothetical protein
MKRWLWMAGISLAAAAWAQEQGAAAPTKDKEADTFEEVERGLYLGVYAGPLFILNPPASEGAPRPFSPGQMAAVEGGLDIGDRLSIGVFFAASANRVGAEYVGFSGGTASGDFGTLIPGAAARLNLVGFNDSQGTTRTYVYLRGGAGFALYYPSELIPTRDLLAFASGGVEYYTRLRHFSVGVEVVGTFLLPSATIGFALTPSLRYAF